MFLYLSGFTKLKEIPQSRLATRKYKELNLRKKNIFKVHPEDFCKRPSQKNACTNKNPTIQDFAEK